MPQKISVSSMGTRQKVTAGVVVVVVLIIVWQIYGLFGGGGSGPAPEATTVAAVDPREPQPVAELPQPKPEALTPVEAQLLKLQQETQEKYINALNQLQMIKIDRDIAENNKALMSAKFETVKVQKDIVDLLAPQVPQATAATYSQGLASSGGESAGAMPGGQQAAQSGEVKYTVVSVSQLQEKWSAVLGYQGNLYNVFIGDVLPADGSKVVSITNTGVILDKNGDKRKLSLVPII
jgi:type IV pilus biogenesis protein PilP